MKRKIVNTLIANLLKLKYVITYYILGSKGILHDILHSGNNAIEIKDMTGYTAVITGGARGIGTSVVELLLKCNIHVVIGCRNVKAGETTVEKIRKSGVLSGTVSIMQLDMMSLASVRKFADRVKKECPAVNILINNAGIMFVPYKETREGYESHFGVNYLAHFLLTQLLLPELKKASSVAPTQSRIINVSSIANEVAPSIDFDNLNMKNFYIEHAAYAQSKLCQILFTKEMEKRLNATDEAIHAIAVHPGLVDTDLFNGTILKTLMPWFIRLTCKTPMQGATSIVYAAISDNLEGKGGLYYSNCRPMSYNRIADDQLIQRKLYSVSMKAVTKFLKE